METRSRNKCVYIQDEQERKIDNMYNYAEYNSVDTASNQDECDKNEDSDHEPERKRTRHELDREDRKRLKQLDDDDHALFLSSDLRRERRMIQNKLYARRARQRKKDEMDELRRRVNHGEQALEQLLKVVRQVCTKEQSRRIVQDYATIMKTIETDKNEYE